MQNSFGTFLKDKRQERNLTQKQLAALLFVSPSAVCKWERGAAYPDITLLPKLSEILCVSEHELITASTDENSRAEKRQAKKWRALIKTYDFFFYISYGIALFTCFIVNLAVSGDLTWFFLVFFSLLLAFSFTSFPKFVKKYKLLIIPTTEFLCLVLLLAACAIYTGGDWFFIAFFSVLFAMLVIFAPILIAKYPIFKRIKPFNAYVSLFIDFISLDLLLVVIDVYTFRGGFTERLWFIPTALPIVTVAYLFFNLLFSVKYLKLNRALKAGIILVMIGAFFYIPPFLIKTDIGYLRHELDSLNFFKADFSRWIPEVTLENNIHLILVLTLSILSVIFLVAGIIKTVNAKKK